MREAIAPSPYEESTALQDSDLLTLVFRSFDHSQGNQQLQVDTIEWAVKRWRDNGFQVDPTSEEKLTSRVSRMRTPKGHSLVGDEEIRAQFGLWWANTWDIIRANYDGEDVPSLEALQERAIQLAERHQVPSLAKEKMDNVAARMQEHRPETSASECLTMFVVPRLIEVEYSYQIDQPYHPVRGRQRTDGGDRCESKMLTHCTSALAKLGMGKPLPFFDEMYVGISNYMDKVEDGAQPEIMAQYESLVAAYNVNHPEDTIERLHR